MEAAMATRIRVETKGFSAANTWGIGKLETAADRREDRDRASVYQLARESLVS
jgi:hypothetical protein